MNTEQIEKFDLELDEPLSDVPVFVARGVDPGKSGIYVFHIEGAGAYVGKYKLPSRYRKTYPLRVYNLLNNLPYKKSKPKGFRPVHFALASALKYNRKISLLLLENWKEEADRKKREDELKHMIGDLNAD